MNQIRKTIGIAALCALTGLGGFKIGQMTSVVDKVTFQEEAYPGGLSSFKLIRLHRPYNQDEIFIKRNGYSHWEAEDCIGTYNLMEEDLGKRYISTFAKEREKDLKRTVGLD